MRMFRDIQGIRNQIGEVMVDALLFVTPFPSLSARSPSPPPLTDGSLTHVDLDFAPCFERQTLDHIVMKHRFTRIRRLGSLGGL
jgi:hypothetical protein